MDPYQVVTDFEVQVARWAGAPHAVAVESCTAAIFLSLMYRNVQGKTVIIPARTYPGVACSIRHAGAEIIFEDVPWQGTYVLRPWGIIDGALRFQEGMYAGGLHCLSFHIKKHLAIGRGGMILTDEWRAVQWLRRARFDGRNPVPISVDNLTMLGWNMYMTPPQAALGIQLFQVLKEKSPLPDISTETQGYPDLRRFPVYTT